MELVQTIIQGGAVGVLVLLILVMWKMSGKVLELFANHINHNTEAFTKLSTAIEELIKHLKNGRK